MMLALKKIRTDGGTQARTALSQPTIDEYAEAMIEGADFEPVVVFKDKAGEHWLADGFHRYHAAKKAKLTKIGVVVRKGEKRAAQLYAIGANSCHGLKRTNEDKRNAVLMLLSDEEWRAWTDGRIANHCAVSQDLVTTMRGELSQSGFEMPRVRKAVRNGKEYEVTVEPKKKPPKAAPRVDTREAQDEAPEEPVYEEGGDDAPPDDYEPDAPRPAPTISPASTKDREGNELQPATLATFDVFTNGLSAIYARLGGAFDAYRNLRDRLDELADAEKLRPGFDLSKALGPALRIVMKLDEEAILVKKSIPWARCYACNGEGCSVCGMAGWLNEVTAKNRRAEVEHAQGAGMSTAPIAAGGGR